MKQTVRSIAAVLLGAGLIVLGCDTALVGRDALHGFLLAMGVMMVLFGGWELV